MSKNSREATESAAGCDFANGASGLLLHSKHFSRFFLKYVLTRRRFFYTIQPYVYVSPPCLAKAKHFLINKKQNAYENGGVDLG